MKGFSEVCLIYSVTGLGFSSAGEVWGQIQDTSGLINIHSPLAFKW